MKKFSKRILSILLSVLMLATTIPAFSLTAQAAELGRDESLNKYIYAYFCGNQGCQLRFAVSDDGYNWEALNGGNVIANATTTDIITFNGLTGMGNQKGIRDPYIIKKPNAEGYYVVATDLDTSYSKNRSGKGNEYNNTNILVWDVNSLADISDVKPWSIDTSGWFGSEYFGKDDDGFLGINRTNNYYNGNGVNVSFCAWAPEVIWDSAKEMYMMYWSACMYDDLRIHYAYTNDFRTFYKADGTVLDGTTGKPDVLYDPGFTSIDGDITYDSSTGKYYMYYKDENTVRNGNGSNSNLIHRVEATSASGPYTNDIVIDTASNGIEGPEVYQLLDGSYILMGDNFSKGTEGGRFVLYKSDTLEGLTGGSGQFVGDAVNLNHLMPSHGAVSYITTEEYNQLIEKFGVSNFDSPALDNVKNVNDHLVARYFTTGDVYEDATGHGYGLTTATNLTVESDETANKSNYALFKGNGVLTTSYQNGSYGVVDTTSMLNDYNFNAADGVTFSWSAKSTQTDVGYGAFFTQVQAGVTPGSLTYDGKNNSHYNTAHTFVYTGKPTFSAGGQGVGAAVYGSDNNIDDVTAFTNGWHDYTVTYVDGFMNLFIDGKLYNRYVTASGDVRQGSPLAVSSINNDWFKQIFTGNLYFGASVFNGQDKMFDGAISDFRIYNKALNQDEIKMSTRILNAQQIAEAMSDYEKNMQSDTFIRTNYAETYKAYMDCKKAYDALTYGSISNGALDEEIDYDELINTLNDKMQDSTRFTTAGTVNVYDCLNTDNPIDRKYSNNLLYYGGTMHNTNDRVAVINSNKVRPYLNYTVIMSDYVMLYDGDKSNLPTAPAKVGFYYNTNITNQKPRSLISCYSNNSELTTVNWRSSDTCASGTWPSNSTLTSYQYNVENATYVSGTEIVDSSYGADKYAKSPYPNIAANQQNKAWHGNGYVTLNPDNCIFPADGTALKIDTSFTVQDVDGLKGVINSVNSDGTGMLNYSSTDKITNKTCYGYVVNYVPVKEAQQRAMDYIQSVKEYQVDNTKFLALLQAIDDSTAINLIGCFTGTTNIEQSANNAQKMVNDAAKKIDDAIAALQVKTEDKYQELRDVIPKAQIIASSSNTRYTAESYAQFEKMFADAQAFMADVYGTNKTHTDKNNYNYNDRAGVIAEALENVLNDLMDVTELRTELETRASIYNDNGEQVSTLSSWLENSDKIQKGHSDLVYLGTAPKYPTTTATYTNLNGETVEYDRVDKSSTNESQVDNAVEQVKTIDLEPIDIEEAYTNFDNVCAVVDAMDRAKYTDEALAEIDDLYKQLNEVEVYAVPSQSASDLYRQLNGVDISGRKLKNTAIDVTDPCTIRLLELVNDAEVNRYTSYLSTIVDNGTESEVTTVEENVPYGNMFSFDVSAQADESSKVVWSATLYKKGDGQKAVNGEVVEPIGSQKISNYTGATMQRKADCDMVVTAKIVKGSQKDSKTVYVKNGYGNIVSVMYVSKDTSVSNSGTTLTVGTENVTIPKLPFYTQTGWDISDNGTDVWATPTYNAVDLKTITVNGGTAEGLNGDQAEVAKAVTITADDENAYGWAVKANGKYQIVGYGSQYSFVVVNDEEYTPIIKTADGYSVDGSALTGDMVDGFQNNTANKVADDEFLKIKLDNKAPFVYNQSVNDKTHYFRITANSDEKILKAHGMRVTKPSGQFANFASTAQNDGGQYSMTMKNDTTGYTFHGYVTYQFTYNFKGVDYNINTTEYCVSEN